MQKHEIRHTMEQLAGLSLVVRSHWSQGDRDRRHRSRPPFRSAPASAHTNASEADIRASSGCRGHLRYTDAGGVRPQRGGEHIVWSNSPLSEEPGAFTLRSRILVPMLLLQRYLVQDLDEQLSSSAYEAPPDLYRLLSPMCRSPSGSARSNLFSGTTPPVPVVPNSQ